MKYRRWSIAPYQSGEFAYQAIRRWDYQKCILTGRSHRHLKDKIDQTEAEWEEFIEEEE